MSPSTGRGECPMAKNGDAIWSTPRVGGGHSPTLAPTPAPTLAPTLVASASRCRIARISSKRAVTSRMIAAMPAIRPVSSRSGTMVNSREIRVPSLRTPERQEHRRGRIGSPPSP